MEKENVEKYEAPVTKHVQVEVEDGICAASITPKPGDDVNEDRHVSIEAHNGGDDFKFGDTSWE